MNVVSPEDRCYQLSVLDGFGTCFFGCNTVTPYTTTGSDRVDMESQSLQRRIENPATRSGGTPDPLGEECLALRNYDGRESHRVTVRFVDGADDIVFRSTHVLAPLGAISVSGPIDRAVYRVEVTMDDETTAAQEILVGSGPEETALVEVGNGLISISEGVA